MDGMVHVPTDRPNMTAYLLCGIERGMNRWELEYASPRSDQTRSHGHRRRGCGRPMVGGKGCTLLWHWRLLWPQGRRRPHRGSEKTEPPLALNCWPERPPRSMRAPFNAILGLPHSSRPDALPPRPRGRPLPLTALGPLHFLTCLALS